VEGVVVTGGVDVIRGVEVASGVDVSMSAFNHPISTIFLLFAMILTFVVPSPVI